MSKKHTIEFVKNSFEKEGWVCTSEEYVNSHQKLDYICSNGHHGSINWNSWQQGCRCLECAGLKRLTIDFVKSGFEKEKYICTSEEYINNNTLLDYICPNGHHGSITWANWQQGVRCSECAGNKKFTIEFIRFEFEKKGWILTSKEYVNSNTKLDYICPNGHHGSISWRHWQRGIRCPECTGNKKHTIEFIKLGFGKEKYVCVSKKYINIHSKLNYICPKGHHGSMTWISWQQGVRCPKCSNNGTSIWESVIKKFVKSLDIPFLANDRTVILNPDTNRYVELDLWFPNLNKAIECNSVYWHKKRKHIDILKREWCRDNNVGLLNLNFEDWEEDIQKCQKTIEKFLN